MNKTPIELIRKPSQVCDDEWLVAVDWVIDNVPEPSGEWAWDRPPGVNLPWKFKHPRKMVLEACVRAWPRVTRYALSGPMTHSTVQTIWPRAFVCGLLTYLGVDPALYSVPYEGRKVFPADWTAAPKHDDVCFIPVKVYEEADYDGRKIEFGRWVVAKGQISWFSGTVGVRAYGAEDEAQYNKDVVPWRVFATGEGAEQYVKDMKERYKRG